MYKLLEDYLNEILFISKPKVQSFKIEGNTCIYVWIGDYDNDYTKSEYYWESLHKCIVDYHNRSEILATGCKSLVLVLLEGLLITAFL